MKVKLPFVVELNVPNGIDTVSGKFVLLAVMTAFTCGVVLGILLLCTIGHGPGMSDRGISLVDSWFMFLGGLWGVHFGSFAVKRLSSSEYASAKFSTPADPSSSQSTPATPESVLHTVEGAAKALEDGED